MLLDLLVGPGEAERACHFDAVFLHSLKTFDGLFSDPCTGWFTALYYNIERFSALLNSSGHLRLLQKLQAPASVREALRPQVWEIDASVWQL